MDTQDQPIPDYLRNMLQDETMSFKKRSGTIDLGRDFERVTIAGLVVHLANNDTFKDFKLSSDDIKFGSFDDIVLELVQTDGLACIYAIQLKYSNNNSTLTKQSLEGTKGDYSLIKYCKQYTNLKKTVDNLKVILYVNNTFDISDQETQDKHAKKIKIVNNRFTIVDEDETMALTAEESHVEQFFLEAAPECRCYKFKLEEKGIRTPKMQEYQEFFDNFCLYVNPMKTDAITRNLKKNALVTEEFLKCLKQWTLKQDKKTKLNKNLIRMMLALSLLDSFIQPLSFTGDLTDNQLLIKQSMDQFRITHLRHDKFDKIRNLWSTDNTNLMSHREVRNIAQLFNISSENSKQLSKLYWILQKCPLVVEYNCGLDKAISLCQHMKFVLLGEKFGILSEVSTFQCLSDLEKHQHLYQKMLTAFGCQLQGKSIGLRTLVEQSEEIPKLIGTDELILMMDGSLEIGEKKEHLPETYIDRYLSRNLIHEEFLYGIDKNTVVIVSGLEDIDEFVQCFADIDVLEVDQYLDSEHPNVGVCVSNLVYTQEEFDEICKKDSSKTCHELRYLGNDKFEWLRSNKDITNLRHFLLDQEFVPESDLVKWEECNSINMVCAGPGMGKSTLMKNLKNNSSPTLWTFLLYARNHAGHFLRCPWSSEDFEDYVWKQSRYRTFDLKLLEIFMKKGQVRYIWDGLDELPEEILSNVVRVIRELKNKGTKHWITSRNHLKEHLEEEFSIIGRTVKAFDEEVQKRYIQQRLMCSEHQLSMVMGKIQRHIQRFVFQDVLGPPLQIYLFTELILRDPQKYLVLMDQILSIADLYKHFVDEQFAIYYRRENADVNNTLSQERFNVFKRDQIDDYGRMALGTYFNRNQLDGLALTDVKNQVDRVGFVVNSDEFRHNSFGEYFSACYLSKHWPEISAFKSFIFEEKYDNIRLFFDLILAEGCRPHLAALYKNPELLRQCSDGELRKKDKAGRNALQVASSWGVRCPILSVNKPIFSNKFIIDERNIHKLQPEAVEYIRCLEFLAENSNCNPLERDELLFNLDSFEYAHLSQCFLSIGIIASKSNIKSNLFQTNLCTILYYSAVHDYSNIFTYVPKMPTIEIQTDSMGKVKFGYGYQFSFNHTVAFSMVDKIIQCDSSRSLKRLLQKPKNIREDKESLLRKACAQNSTQIIYFCIDEGADLEASDAEGRTSLYIACESGSYAAAEMLMAHNANLMAQNKDGLTPMHCACWKGHYEIVELLIEKLTNLEILDNGGSMPIHYACASESMETVCLLIEMNVNLEAKNKQGQRPIHYACVNSSGKILKLLEENGVDVEAAANSGQRPIHFACESGSYEIVDFLISKRVDVNAVDRLGETPLHKACKSLEGSLRIVESLITSGAQMDVQNNEGRSPLDLAKEESNDEIVKFLEKMLIAPIESYV